MNSRRGFFGGAATALLGLFGLATKADAAGSKRQSLGQIIGEEIDYQVLNKPDIVPTSNLRIIYWSRTPDRKTASPEIQKAISEGMKIEIRFVEGECPSDSFKWTGENTPQAIIRSA